MRPPGYGYDREILVGLFMMLGIFVVGLFSMKITDSPIFRSGTEYSVILTDASGIFKNSKVKIAGINVGIVKEIKLTDGQAKITILVDKGHSIDRGSYILPRTQGILGDRYLEIVLPKNDTERENLRRDGGQEFHSESSRISPSYWERGLDWIFPVAWAQETFQAGEVIPAKPGSATTDDVMRKLGEVGDEVRVLARDLKEIVRDNKSDINASLKAIRRSADNMDLLLRDLSEKETRTDLKESIRGLREAVHNIRDISDRINKGEGTIGKLINDPQAADQLVRALNSIVEFLDKAKRTEIIVDLNSNYLSGVKKTKTYMQLRILPRSSYGYLLGLVQDPGGRETITTTTTSVNNGPDVVTREKKVEKKGFRYNFQFIRKIYRTTFRLGLFESSGGAAIDHELWKNHFYVTVEAFDFGRENENAHVRVLARLKFLDSVYLQGGVDEMAAKRGKTKRDSIFGGIGLEFNDNDLKNFLLLFGF